jgi:hypothetical protein
MGEDDKKKQRPRDRFNQAHPNSLLAQTIGNPELKKKYDAWKARNREEALALERWARADYQSGGEESFERGRED